MVKNNQLHIKIVDLFAGPGGLGEGFSAHDDFRIAVSAEMESSAHATLRLRAFYRALRRQGVESLKAYYDICHGAVDAPNDGGFHSSWGDVERSAWKEACSEALRLTLGKPEDNAHLDEAIRKNEISGDKPWVLIGGPPCQAYSLVGRARNRGKEGYTPEGDGRHFLYEQYLRVISVYQPAIFVMENVKGILSSTIDGQKIFHKILRDLSDPGVASGSEAGLQYDIYSLSTDASYSSGDSLSDEISGGFIVRAEDYGIPQARHRVILVGVRKDLINDLGPLGLRFQLAKQPSVHVDMAISDLPRLRSKISRGRDSDALWRETVAASWSALLRDASTDSRFSDLCADLQDLVYSLQDDISCTQNKLRKPVKPEIVPDELWQWYASGDESELLRKYLNHESRGHMPSDLRRYAFATVFSKVRKVSPKGHNDFALPGLAPEHKNWSSGKFSDRFKVQLCGAPSSTVTSHISKDGHYFIHYDPEQCRSLTVREAARLQTFPDNYFFQGTKTQQYHQVGNAVPPLLAYKIADVVKGILQEFSLKAP